LLVGAYLWSCEEADPLVDPNQDILDNYGEIRTDTLLAKAVTFIVKGKINSGNSSKLLLGFNKDFDTRFLVKFEKFPADTIVLDSLKIRLTSNSKFGEPTGPIRGKVYLVTNEWQESVNSDLGWDYKSNIDYTPETSAEFELIYEDSAIYVIDLPPILVDIWRDTTIGNQNFGLLFDYSEAQHIIEISSSEAPGLNDRPKLIYMYHNAALDSTIRDTATATSDAYLVDFEGSFDLENLYVVAGYSVNAFIKFDFSVIPQTAILSSVDFFLKQDSVNSIINSNRGKSFYLRNAISEYDQLPEYTIDSTFVFNISYNVLLSEDEDKQMRVINSTRSIVAQNFIQSIVNQDISHGSFYLEYTNQASEISVYALRDSEDPFVSSQPKLVVEYYLPPGSRL
jgi:hypothetical protein